MANKKKKVGSHHSKIKQQYLADLNERTVLALEAPSRTVHATVPPISNSNPCPPVVSPSELSKPIHHVPSSSHGSLPQIPVDPSPSINHVFEEDFSDDGALDDEEVDFASSGEDYAGGSKFFTSSVVEAPSVPAVFPLGAQSVSVAPPACTVPAPVASPESASSPPVVPVEVDVPLAATVSATPNPSEPPPKAWRNLFAHNRNVNSCPKLLHYSVFTETRGCTLLDDDLDTKCALWKLSLVGYIAGRSPGFKAIQNLIVNSWHCEASLTIHASGWLIFQFANEEDKLNVLSGGPYLVYGRPLILRAMPEYFDFSSSDMHTVPVWVQFPNLPFTCWSLKCLSKIASVIGKPVQSDMLTHSMSKLSYARVLVEVNLLSDLPYSIEVTLPNGSILHQQVVYETLPRFCKHCRTLGHITSTCPKSQPTKVSTTQRAPVSVAPVSNGRSSVFNRLGPQGDAVVVDNPEAVLPAECGPNPLPVETELVSANGDAVPSSGAWEVVRNKKAKRKPPPSRTSSGFPFCLAHETPPLVHRERQPTPPLPAACNTHASAHTALAGHRSDKGKSVVSGASGHCPPSPTGLPTRRRAQQHMSGVPDRGEGLLPTPSSLC
jgi:hypothetical protein